jgi:hypothetical protein
LSRAVLATAYVSAITGKHYPLATVVALAGLGLTVVTFLIVLRESAAVGLAGPVLAELQGRVADRLKLESMRNIGTPPRMAQSNFPGVMALGLALLVDIAALLYALIH